MTYRDFLKSLINKPFSCTTRDDDVAKLHFSESNTHPQEYKIVDVEDDYVVIYYESERHSARFVLPIARINVEIYGVAR